MDWTEEHGKELLEDKLLTAQVIKENYISKDKIREKIEETEKELYNGEILQAFAFIRIETLRELLEES